MITNAPVNSLGLEVRQGLLTAEQVAEDNDFVASNIKWYVSRVSRLGV